MPEFATSEGDAWFVAPGVVVWRIDGIEGSSFWGRVTTAQVDIAFDVVRQYANLGATRPFEVISDVSAVTSFDDDIYACMSSQIAELLPRIVPRVRRHVVIVPDGVIRVAAAGFLHLHGQYGWHIAGDLAAAVGEPIAARVSTLVAGLRDADLVTALRSHHLGETLPVAAKALGVAPRTLQRALRSAGTTFRAIVEEGRIAAACRLLDHSDLKVEAIAREVGYRSLSGFVRSFRRTCGCSPHERRARSPRWRPASATID